MKYARIDGGLVVEIIEPFEDVPIEERFHPDLVAQMVQVPDGTVLREGMRFIHGEFTEPEPVETIAPPVTSVTMRQARLALHAVGALQDVQDLIATAGVAADIEWEFAATVERDSPLVQLMATSLDLDLDALFADAATR